MKMTKNGDSFIVVPEAQVDREKILAAGLDFSRPGRVHYTTEPYAALEFYPDGDAEARAALEMFKLSTDF